MVVFELIRYKNILSTGNYFTEIKLNGNKNTLIVGNNGSGKSTILDALTFGLFGKPFRKINKPSLLNSINQSNGVVEILFSIGKKKYKVVRGIKPNIFSIYCDDVLINQDSKIKDYQEFLEKNILKFNFKSFTQIVILGSAAFIPFMQLPAADRRAIIEDLLDIQIFSSMNLIVKQKLSDNKETISTIKYDIDLTKDKIEIHENNLKQNKKNTREIIRRKKEEVEKNLEQVQELNEQVKKLQQNIEHLNVQVKEKRALEEKYKTLSLLESKMTSNAAKIDSEIHFFNHNDDCPTCRQKIDDEFKKDQVEAKKTKLEELNLGLAEMERQSKNLEEKLKEIRELSIMIETNSTEIIQRNASINSILKYNNSLNNEIVELIEKTEGPSLDNTKLEELNEKLKDLDKKLESTIVDKQYLDVCSNLLKDTGIKTKIIKQYLPIMNKLINKYLKDMDFFVSFNLDENFEETIKSRHLDEFTYSNFSEGEKQKIDLALLFAWRQIAKLKNSTNTNLLILDEVFDSSLDTNAVDFVLKMFSEMGSDTNLFVISHRGDQLIDKFGNIINFTKTNNFSKMT